MIIYWVHIYLHKYNNVDMYKSSDLLWKFLNWNIEWENGFNTIVIELVQNYCFNYLSVIIIIISCIFNHFFPKVLSIIIMSHRVQVWLFSWLITNMCNVLLFIFIVYNNAVKIFNCFSILNDLSNYFKNRLLDFY